MLWSAFLLGLVGSLHCIGMCGPLTLLLPYDGRFSSKFVFGRISYNLGRVVTYSLLGATAGFFGEKVAFSRFLERRCRNLKSLKKVAK